MTAILGNLTGQIITMESSIENSVEQYHIGKADLLRLLQTLFSDVVEDDFKLQVRPPAYLSSWIGSFCT